MRDIAEELSAWLRAGTRFALATVVRTWSSAPRGPGASMAVAETGEVVGSVSGGCVESAVYELARDVLASGEPQLVSYGVSDDDAFAVGLTCGGTVQILVQPADPDHFAELPTVLDEIRAGTPVAVGTVLCGHAPSGRHVVVDADSAAGDPVMESCRQLLACAQTGIAETGGLSVFVQSFVPPPRMLVFGALDHAAAVARIGKFLGYRVTVCDARRIFVTRARFPDADELVVDWPHRFLDRTPVDGHTVICVLTHDPKFDIPLLERALLSPAAYIGALGSHRTHADRVARLRAAGVGEAGLARLSAPIGLDLGARTPEEVAVAVAAEILARARGGSGRPLREGSAPIHR